MEPQVGFFIPLGGNAPVDPGYGQPGGPVDPGYGRPGYAPGRPSHDLPGYGHVWLPGHLPQPPGSTLPEFPPTINPPPPAIWPGLPVFPLPPTINPPPVPGSVYPPLPPNVTGKLLALVAIIGVGYRWIVIDADARPQPK